MIGGQTHRLRLARPLIAPADDLVSDGDTVHPLTDFRYHAGEVAALPGRERGRPNVSQQAPSDRSLTRIDGGGHHVDDYPTWPGVGTGNIYDVKDVNLPVLVEAERLGSWNEPRGDLPAFASNIPLSGFRCSLPRRTSPHLSRPSCQRGSGVLSGDAGGGQASISPCNCSSTERLPRRAAAKIVIRRP